MMGFGWLLMMIDGIESIYWLSRMVLVVMVTDGDGIVFCVRDDISSHHSNRGIVVKMEQVRGGS